GLPDALAQLKPVHTGQADVDDDEHGPVLVHELEGPLAARGQQGAEASVAEVEVEEVGDAGVVLGHDDGLLARRRHGQRTLRSGCERSMSVMPDGPVRGRPAGARVGRRGDAGGRPAPPARLPARLGAGCGANGPPSPPQRRAAPGAVGRWARRRAGTGSRRGGTTTAGPSGRRRSPPRPHPAVPTAPPPAGRTGPVRSATAPGGSPSRSRLLLSRSLNHTRRGQTSVKRMLLAWLPATDS